MFTLAPGHHRRRELTSEVSFDDFGDWQGYTCPDFGNRGIQCWGWLCSLIVILETSPDPCIWCPANSPLHWLAAVVLCQGMEARGEDDETGVKHPESEVQNCCCGTVRRKMKDVHPAAVFCFSTAQLAYHQEPSLAAVTRPTGLLRNSAGNSFLPVLASSHPCLHQEPPPAFENNPQIEGCGGPPLIGVDQQHHEGGGERVFAYIFGGSDAEGNASDELW